MIYLTQKEILKALYCLKYQVENYPNWIQVTNKNGLYFTLPKRVIYTIPYFKLLLYVHKDRLHNEYKIELQNILQFTKINRIITNQ